MTVWELLGMIVCTLLILTAVTAGVFALVGNDCTADALALAESAVEVTDDLAQHTSTSLSLILSGGSPDYNGMDRIANQHRDNAATLEDLQEQCD